MHKRVLYGLIVAAGMLISISAEAKKPVVPDSLLRIELEIGGVPLTMQRVEGGSFTIGATWEQTDRDIYTNKPAHLVLLSPYYIATTEVTNALWRVVMPEKETLSPRGYPTNPISYVTWHDCQEFVRRLDSITGLPFRLPTEAEWEYAARGGAKSRSNRFAGGLIADSVGWIYSCSGNWTHPVARKQPNELGLYDMTGNVSEWCQDRYGAYTIATQPNPQGPDSGLYRIARGGSYDDCAANSHLSVRRWYVPETAAGYIGFRLAFTLPNDPMMQVVPEEPPLTRTIHVKGKRIRFYYVAAEQPYYISEEVSRAFYEKHDRRLWEQEICLASRTEVDTALQRNVIYQAAPKKKHWQRDTRSIQQHRRMTKTASMFTELVGLQLKQADDPVLAQFQEEQERKKTVRLVIHIR